MSECKCRLCDRDRNIESIKASGDIQQMRDLIDILHDDLSHTEDDLDYNKAILDGSWPQARETLERSLGRCKPQNPPHLRRKSGVNPGKSRKQKA